MFARVAALFINVSVIVSSHDYSPLVKRVSRQVIWFGRLELNQESFRFFLIREV